MGLRIKDYPSYYGMIEWMQEAVNRQGRAEMSITILDSMKMFEYRTAGEELFNDLSLKLSECRPDDSPRFRDTYEILADMAKRMNADYLMHPERQTVEFRRRIDPVLEQPKHSEKVVED